MIINDNGKIWQGRVEAAIAFVDEFERRLKSYLESKDVGDESHDSYALAIAELTGSIMAAEIPQLLQEFEIICADGYDRDFREEDRYDVFLDCPHTCSIVALYFGYEPTERGELKAEIRNEYRHTYHMLKDLIRSYIDYSLKTSQADTVVRALSPEREHLSWYWRKVQGQDGALVLH